MFQKLLAERNVALIRKSLEFFLKELNISEEENNIINVEIVRRLPDALGRCSGTYYKDELKSIKIELLQEATTMGIIETLAHELVHAKQNLRGDFHFIEVEKKVFFGLFKVKIKERAFKGQILSETPYYDQIAEQEAHTVSLELVSKFMKIIHEEVYNKKEEILMVESF